MHDAELLQAYEKNGDERAFNDFVARYANLVYSTAFRRLNGDSLLAEEVTQTVFLLAARKARSLATHPAVPAWLYRTAWQAAENSRRSEMRRKLREREADQMNIEDESRFDELLPVLDDAMLELSEPDRLVLLSRFFLKKTMREAGASCGISEAAAKMRVSRALQHLRDAFTRRGIACSAALLGILLQEKGVQAAPAALLDTIAGAIPHAITSGGFAAFSAKILILMSYSKPIQIGLAALLVALLGVGVYESPLLQSRRTHESVTSVTFTTPSASRVSKLTGTSAATMARSPDASAAALERLRLALAMPLPKSGISWPCPEVIEAVQAVPDKHAAFEALKAVIANPQNFFTGNLGVADPAGLVCGRAMKSLRYLASDVPEVKPFLWDTYKRPPDVMQAFDALLGLKDIGITGADLPDVIAGFSGLGNSPAVRRMIPQMMADVIAADPEGSGAAISLLQAQLAGPDQNLRLTAACALATSRFADPRVAGLLEEAITGTDKFTARLGVEAMQKAGTQAAPFVPELLDLANNTTDPSLRRDTLRAVAAIHPATSETQPEVAKVVATDAVERDLGERLQNGGASIDDLMAALRVPQYATIAAARLGELGSFAAQAVPLLRAALEGRDQDARDQIVNAIQKVSPETKIERVGAKTMADAIMATDISLGPRGDNYDDPVTKAIMERRAFTTWWTRDEVVSYARRLATLDPQVARTFSSNVIERDPSMRDILTR